MYNKEIIIGLYEKLDFYTNEFYEILKKISVYVNLDNVYCKLESIGLNLIEVGEKLLYVLEETLSEFECEISIKIALNEEVTDYSNRIYEYIKQEIERIENQIEDVRTKIRKFHIGKILYAHISLGMTKLDINNTEYSLKNKKTEMSLREIEEKEKTLKNLKCLYAILDDEYDELKRKYVEDIKIEIAMGEFSKLLETELTSYTKK